jgi:hypothetical protein
VAGSPGGAELLAIAELCGRALGEHVDRDWTVGVPDLEMTVAGVVAHASETGLWYAIDLSAGGAELDATVEHRVKADGPNAMLVDTMTTYARVLAAVVDASPATARGFHPMGAADPSGFAAMAGDEYLVHTDDALRGLGEEFAPPEELAAVVLARLFPEVPGLFADVDRDEDAWSRLRWANGRIALGDRPRRRGWRWHCAPLEEWDGTLET